MGMIGGNVRRFPHGLIPATFEAAVTENNYVDYFSDMTSFMESIKPDIDRLMGREERHRLLMRGVLNLNLEDYGVGNYNHFYLQFKVGEKLVELRIGTVAEDDQAIDEMWQSVADVVEGTKLQNDIVASVSFGRADDLHFSWTVPRFPEQRRAGQRDVDGLFGPPNRHVHPLNRNGRPFDPDAPHDRHDPRLNPHRRPFELPAFEDID